MPFCTTVYLAGDLPTSIDAAGKTAGQVKDAIIAKAERSKDMPSGSLQTSKMLFQMWIVAGSLWDSLPFILGILLFSFLRTHCLEIQVPLDDNTRVLRALRLLDFQLERQKQIRVVFKSAAVFFLKVSQGHKFAPSTLELLSFHI